MANKIQLRRDTYQNWYDTNPTLSQGEPAFDVTNNKLKIGNGTSAWRDLEYTSGSSGGSVAGVVSVNGHTGTVVLTKADFNLSNVDNTSDSAKPISTATASALSLKESLSNKGIASGYVGLNNTAKIDSIFLPAITLNNRFAVTTLAERNALSAAVGDIAIVAGTVNKTYILNSLPASSDASWLEMLNPLGGVTSINGSTGVVSLTLANIPGTLAAAKLPALSGDVTSTAGTGVLTLSNSGITAGTYNRVTFDAKGRATSGETVDYATTNASLLTSGTLGVARLPAFTGDVVSSAGTGVLTLGASGVTAGNSYNSITVNAKGIVTAASLIPVYNKTEIDSQMSLKLNTNKLNQPNGYAGLNSNSKIDSLYLPAITINNRFAVSTIAQRNALNAAVGDIAIVAGTVNKTYILNALPASSDGNWLEMLNPLGGVTSVNGHDGVVTITLNDLTGTISATALPALTGDVISTAGSNVINLHDISTAGTYNKLTINAKGLVTNASSETTLDGLGITDAINKSSLPVSGDASLTQIVLGNDSRLTDDRNPKTHTVSKISDFNSAVDTKITNALASFTSGVSSVNTKTGAIVLDKTDIGLGAVDNTSDLSKPISTATSAALALSEVLANKGIANGYAGLNALTKIDTINLPAMTLNNRFVVTDLTARDALSAAVGDVAIVAGSVNKTFILNALPASVDANWLEMLNPLGGVTSINGSTGVVSLTLANIPGTLTAAKLPALTGDVTSTAGTGVLTLSNSGITAGTYNHITFDTKGRALFGETVDYATTNASLLTSGTLGVARLPAFTGDVVSSVGTGVLTLGTSGVTAGANYNSITVNTKGIVTAASLIPVYNKTEIDSQMSLKLNTNKLNQANGYVGLNSNSKIDSLYLPAITINNRFAVTTIAQRNALTAAVGDIAIVAGTVNKTYILNALPASSDANWLEMLNPLGGVTSVNGHTGVVTLTLNDLTGTISATALPALTGDVISSAGSNTISLNSITTAGTFNKLHINDKGLVINASLETTLAGLGITDGTTVSQVNELIAAAIGSGGSGNASITMSSTAPTSPIAGALWFDTNSGRLYIYYNTVWVDANPETGGTGGSSSITTSDTAPSSPSVGDLWYDTTGGRLYVYFSNTWIDTNPETAGSGGSSSVTVNSVSPSSASIGDLWYDTVSGRLYIYFSSTWVDTSPEPTNSGGSTTTMNDTPPTSPNPGDMWFDTVGGRLYIRYSNAWVDTNPNPN